jgi:hypothetical protein
MLKNKSSISVFNWYNQLIQIELIHECNPTHRNIT